MPQVDAVRGSIDRKGLCPSGLRAPSPTGRSGGDDRAPVQSYTARAVPFTAPKASAALIPPNPNELETAYRTFRASPVPVT